jgi:hypothetical protein
MRELTVRAIPTVAVFPIFAAGRVIIFTAFVFVAALFSKIFACSNFLPGTVH